MTSSDALVLLRFAPQVAGLVDGLQLGQRLGLDLADALPGDAEPLGHLFQGARVLALEAEAQLDDLALPVGQHGEGLVDPVPVELQRPRRRRSARRLRPR